MNRTRNLVEHEARAIAQENIRDAFAYLYKAYTYSMEGMMRKVELDNPDSVIYEGCLMGMKHALLEFKDAYKDAYRRKML